MKTGFSVIITCHNQQEFIRDAVESAILQTVEAKEVIVVDDASADGSREALREYLASIRLIFLSENQGALNARNIGANAAQGEYLVFLDGDDLLAPWALEVYEQVIERAGPKFIAGLMTMFNGKEVPRQDKASPQLVQIARYDNIFEKDRPQFLSASSVVVERQAFEGAGGWSPDIFQMDLVDFATKLGCVGPFVLMISPYTALYRVHGTNTIHKVEPFLRMARYILHKERAGRYPGGEELKFKRRAWLGGSIFFWTKRGLQAGLYTETLRLALSGCPMIFAAVLRRTVAWVRGRKPIEIIETAASGYKILT
jgi:glycosyltransferase involved in cell wall biosynthesis